MSADLPLKSKAGADAGTRSYLSKIYDSYWSEICLYVRKSFGLAGPESEDVAQTAFTRFSALDDPHSITNPRAFLYRTAHNIAIDKQRRRQRRDRLLHQTYPESDGETGDDLGPERVSIGKEELQAVEAALQKLSRRDRTFLLLNRLEGLSFAEIARRTGMSPSGVRWIIEQALETCQLALDAPEGSHD